MNPVFKSQVNDLMRIEADQVCVDYNGTVALYDASLNLRAGSICGLVGMNGGEINFF